MDESTTMNAALATAARGKPVFPCGPDKKPLTKNGFKDATTDHEQIKKWWERHPDALIGMPTGKASGITALDIDVDIGKAIDGNDALFELEQAYSTLPDTPEVITPRGGTHKYFKYVPGIRNSAGKLGLGLDIRGEGGYVIVPPSGVNGHRYEWEASSLGEFAEMPKWMIGLLKPQSRTKKKAAKTDNAINEGGRNAHLTSLAGSMRRRDMSAEGMEAALLQENASRCIPPLPESEVRVIAQSIGRYEPAAQQPPASVASNDAHWRDLLIYNADESPRPRSINNALVYLTWHPLTKGVFAHDDFALSIDVTKPPPWGDTNTEYPRKIDDTDVTKAAAWLEQRGIFVGTSSVYAALVASARHHCRDPLMDYINGLRWDGKPRISGWTSRLLGAEATPYNEVVGRKFLIGAIARAIKPGCQMDNMLVLEGGQGILKSSAVRTLFGAEWFTDEIHVIGSKDAAMQLLGNWAIEIPEMHAMSKAEASQIKEWITRRVDKYRPPYGKCVIESPRRCVLIGTLNPEGGYLKDATGGRRFWPVATNKIDLDAIKAERNQLFAEALVAYRNNEPWWLNSGEEKLAREQQEERYESDPWGEVIDEYVLGRAAVTTAEIMEFALQLKKNDWTRSAEMRVGKYLVSIGRTRKREGGRKRKWLYCEKK